MTYAIAEKIMKKIGINEGAALEVLSVLLLIVTWLFLVIRLGMGVHDSNKPNKCIVKNFNDIIISPVYAIGCNLGKDRFNKRLN